MKVIGVILGSLALVGTVLFPPLLFVTCPLGALGMLIFVYAARKEREALARQRHRDLVDAARYRPNQ